MRKYRIGVDVGGTKIAYAIFDENYKMLHSKTSKSRPELSSNAMIDLIINDINDLISQSDIPKDQFLGIGADFPAHIHYKSGTAITVTNLPKWKNVKIKDIMQDKLGLDVYVDNDANAACLAEARLGAGIGHKDMIYVTISTGIGGGLYLNDDIYRGTYGAAGEIGHIIISSDTSIICGCGNTGCAEAIASGTAMTKYAKQQINNGVKSIITELSEGFDNISPYFIAQAYNKGDKLADEIFERTSSALASLFSSLYQTFNVDLIVYGGGVSKIGPPLMDKVQEKFIKLCPMAMEYKMEIVPAKLNDQVNILGAALLVQ